MYKQSDRAMRFVASMLAFLLAFGSPVGASQEAKSQKQKGAQAPSQSDAAKKLTEEQKVAHLLDRVTLGARPGDVERVMKLGWEKYLDEQLRPERISDQAVEQRLKNIESIHLSSAELAKNYPPPQVLQQVLKERGIELPGQNQNAGRATKKDAKQSFKQLGREAERKKDDQMDDQAPARPLDNPQADNPQPGVNDAAKRREAYQALREMGYRPPQEVVQESQQAKILRAVYSERQLQEVMTDFWFNHFNVYVQKGPDRILTASYERDAIRPNVFGKFEDLLKATAEHPAMLFYLDNWMSASPNAKMPDRNEIRRMRRERRFGGFGGGFGNRGMRRMEIDDLRTRNQNGKVAKRSRGLNENYAREIMELHTLGVDGGYTQKDVQEVARCFTGWTIRKPNEVGLFFFNPRTHDNGEKIVLGHKIPAGGGISDGDKVLDILARHPSTANFIATKLARRFVGDDPPRSVINRAAATFLKTNGSIRETLRTIIASAEFFSADAYRAKMRTPFEYVAAAMRAVGAETDADPSVFGWIARMGQPIFGRISTDGYPDRAAQWLASGAMLERLNFAVALSSNKLKGTNVDPARILSQTDLNSPTATADHLSQLILIGGVSDETRRAIDKIAREASAIPATANTLPATRATQPINYANTAVIDNPKTPVAPLFVAGLISIVLGSPEFQRR